MLVEIHVYNVKSQLVPLLPNGNRIKFPQTYSNSGKSIEHPLIRALDKELQYEVDALIQGRLQKVPVKRFSARTYKFDTGCISYVTKILKTFQQPFRIVDKRVVIPPGEVIPFREGVEPRPYQTEATMAALKAKRGVLRLATGAGKTFIAWDILRQLNLPTVIFVHTVDLLDQFKEAGEFFLNMEIGKVGNGEVDIKQFTVATMQTVCKAFDQKYVNYEIDPDEGYTEDSIEYNMQQKMKVREIVEKAAVIVADECFAAGTLVLDKDGIPRAIENIKNDNHVLSYSQRSFSEQKTSNCFERISTNNIEIQTTSTIHMTSASHKWLVYDSEIEGFKLKTSEECKKGEYLLSIRKSPHKTLNSMSIEEAQFLALIAVDGHSEERCATIKVEVSKDVEYFREAFVSSRKLSKAKITERLSERSKENPKYKDTFVFSIYDENLQSWLSERGVPRGDKSAVVDIPDEIFVAPIETVAKYVNTIFCCEGSIGERCLTIQTTSNIFIKKLQLLLLKFGIHTKYQRLDYDNWNTKYDLNAAVHHRLDICDLSSLEIFAKEIRLDIPRKQEALDSLISSYVRSREIILGNSVICKYVECFGKSLISLWKDHKISIKYPAQNPQDTISIPVVDKVLKLFEHEKHSEKQFDLRTLILKIRSCHFDKICKITKKTEAISVYDFTVENTHKFIAQTNITSNCHHLSCQTLQTLFKCAKNAFYRYGLTATMREDGADIVIYGVTGQIVSNVTASYLIEHNPPYLVRPIIYYMKVKRPRGGDNNYHSRYKSDIVEYEPRNELIIQSAIRLVKKGFRVLVLARQIKHLKLLRDMMKSGFKSEWEEIKDVDSSQIKFELATGAINKKERKRIIQEMKEDKLECLFASTIADEGLDCPPISAVILAGAGKSATKAFQRVGRALRLFPGKEKAVIVDFYDQGKFFKKHAECRMELFKREPAFKLKIQA